MMTGLSLPLGVNSKTSTEPGSLPEFCSTLYTEGSSQHNQARKKASILKKNKIVFITGKHNHLCWKSDGIYKKATITRVFSKDSSSPYVGSKIDIQKLIVFLCISHGKLEGKMLFRIASHTQKDETGINLTKAMKNLYYKTMKTIFAEGN